MDEFEMLKEKCRALEEALAAANSDAARAELRARDRERAIAVLHSGVAPGSEAALVALDTLAAAPDSDARLREVVGKSLRRGYEVASSAGQPNFEALIDEVLGVKS